MWLPCDLTELTERIREVDWLMDHHPPPTTDPLELVGHLQRLGIVHARAKGVDRPYDVPGIYRAPFGLRRRSGATQALDAQPDPSADKARPRVPPAVLEKIDRLFCGTRGAYGRFTRPADEEGRVVIPDCLFRFRLINEDRQGVSLQVYVDLDTVGGALWTRASRALSQVSATRHPSLPDIVGGGYINKEDIAYVITKAARHRLSDPGAMGLMANNLPRALHHMTLLAHALSILHRSGISHLNLHPGSIEYIPTGRHQGTHEQTFNLRLARFEMSSLIGNLLRHQLDKEIVTPETKRTLYLQGIEANLAYYPPERVEWLYGETSAYMESDRSDVYALGVIAWCWLANRSDALPTGLKPGVEVHRALNRQFRERLQRCGHLPRPLMALLGAMLEPKVQDRCSMADVVQKLSQNYGRWSNALAPAAAHGHYYLAFMPVESKKTVHAWGWIRHDPTEDLGLEELKAYLEHELRGAALLLSPGGFAPFRPSRSDTEQRSFETACYVLRGKQAYWFCDYFRKRGPAYRRDDERHDERLLLIKYVTARRYAWQLDDSLLARPIPGEIQLLPYWSDQPIETDALADGLSWRELVRPLEASSHKPAWQTEIRALSFLLALRKVALEAREFPYRLVTSSGLVHTIARDVERDQRRTFADPMRRLYAGQFRAPMGLLFGTLDGERAGILAVRSGDTRTRVVFVEYLDQDTVKVRHVRGQPSLPERGWISPADDYGERRQQQRQTEATLALQRHEALLQQINQPFTIPGLRTRWAGAGRELRGRGPEIVKQMLTQRPFYALHGPPGSGKTTVTAHAVAATLRVDPSQRVLVSSQSHHALDNLAVRIMAQLRTRGVEVLALRVASESAMANDRVDEQMQALSPERQATKVIERAAHTATAALRTRTLKDGRRLSGVELEVIADWQETAPKSRDEIERRLRRGANIVFSTANSCTADLVNPLGGLFDWAIIEEAARAWPTELALPLVQATRWTLIGDHIQLPAFDVLTVERFLDACEVDPDDTLNEHARARRGYRKVYNLFGTLFDGRASRRRARTFKSRLVEPLAELDLQFRMHPDIGALVSRTFYHTRIDPQSGERVEEPGGWLGSDDSTRRPHGLSHPRFLRDRALVWLDTTGLPDSDDRRAWKNHAEVRLVKALLERLDPAPTDKEQLAILSPYREQLDMLRAANLPSWAHAALHTIDSFQGREAEIVIVSMVRSTMRVEPVAAEGRASRLAAPEANIGYLVAPERINVMLSRARRLLIIVGRAEHFERQVDLFPERDDIVFWRTLIDELRRQGALVRATDLGFGGE